MTEQTIDHTTTATTSPSPHHASQHWKPKNSTLATTPPRRTSLFVWFSAVICTIIALAVIIAGIVVFVGYLIIHPRVPSISVIDAHLNQFEYDLAGILVTQVNIVVRSQNNNRRAHASFSRFKLSLIFDGLEIARLVAAPYEVTRHDHLDFNYLATSEPIALNPQQMQDVDVSLNQDVVRFEIKGSARARWKIGLFGSVRFLCHLNCQLDFHRSNGSYTPNRCTSKAK